MTIRKLTALACLALAAAGCGKIDTGGGGEGDLVNFKRGYVFVRSRDVYVADSSDYQAARQLTHSANCSDPAISADGRVIVYISGGTSLRKVNPDGTADSVLVPASGATLSKPAVSPDASRVAYVSASASLSTIHTVNVDGTGDNAIPGSLHDTSPSFYPDGSAVLVLNGPDILNFIEMDRVELTAGTRAVRVDQSTGMSFTRAALSPAGDRVAAEAKSGSMSHVYVLDEFGGTPQRLANSGASERSPTWVSNTRAGFVSDFGGQTSIYESDLGAGLDAFTLAVGDADQGAYGGQ